MVKFFYLPLFYSLKNNSLIIIFTPKTMTMGSLMIMASDFRSELQSSIPDATKDPPSSFGVCAHKICGSESPVVSC